MQLKIIIVYSNVHPIFIAKKNQEALAHSWPLLLHFIITGSSEFKREQKYIDKMNICSIH